MNFLCALTNLTILFHIQKAPVVLLPKNRVLCPPINQDTEVIFYLYTRKNVDEPQRLKLDNDTLLNNSSIDFTKKTKFFFHGFIASHETLMSQLIKNASLEAEDVNMIVVDMSMLTSGIDYITSVVNVKPISQLSAKFVEYLVSKGLKLKDLHLMGMSIGAHVAGITASLIESGEVERVTGLDPAGPLFYLKSSSSKISKTDAKYVDVIHTNAGIFGSSQKMGKADFWVNGGTHQPSCDVFNVFIKYKFQFIQYIFCSHMRAFKIYGETLSNRTEIMAYKCDDGVRKFNKKSCDADHPTIMGAYVNTSTEGDYAVITPRHASYY